MTHPEALAVLHGLRQFGARFGLDTIRRLATLAGDPHRQLRFLHVAGTNGKGSTCAFLAAIHRAAGRRVGLYVSPHLVSLGERIQINGVPLDDVALTRAVAELVPWLAEFSPADQPTFFEVMTVIALRQFAAAGCDVVVWETGLGGRLDATNLVTPVASVITNIGLDHTQWLGTTVEAIAAEKAGIIKRGVSVFTAATEPGVLKVLQRVAREQGAPLTVIGGADAAALPVDPSLAGPHQRWNAALAAAVVRGLQGVLPVTEAALREGLQHTAWPGRLEPLDRPGRGRVWLDGAHNPPAAEVLRAALPAVLPAGPDAVILGVFADKDWAAVCRSLATVAPRILLVPVASDRTARPADLLSVCQSANPGARIEVCASLREALDRTITERETLVTGSLYLVGEARELLVPTPGRTVDEKAFNEWTAGPAGTRRG